MEKTNEKREWKPEFLEWLKKKEYVTELNGRLYYRFKGKKNDFLVRIEDVPENMLMGDEFEFAAEKEDDFGEMPFNEAVSVSVAMSEYVLATADESGLTKDDESDIEKASD